WRIFNANLNPANISTSNDNQWHAFSLPVAIKTTLADADLSILRVLCGIARDDAGPAASSETAWFDNIQLTPANASFNLTATRISETQINLAWLDIYSDETGYAIERCNGIGCTNFAPLTTLGTGTTSYSDLGLVPNTYYSYRIKTYKT